jgi:hypothetical protein
MEDDVVPRRPKAEAKKAEPKTDELGSLLRSKRALKAFHEKCLQFVHEKNVSYLSPDDMTTLLGGPSRAKANFVRDLINTMLTNVCL